MKTKARKPSPPREVETDIVGAVLDLLTALGVPHFRSNAGGGYRLGRGGRPQLIHGAPEGWPDVTGWLPRGPKSLDGRMLLIEVKRPEERPTPEQLGYLLRVNADGGVGLWVDDAAILARAMPLILQGYGVAFDEAGDWDLRPPD